MKTSNASLLALMIATLTLVSCGGSSSDSSDDKAGTTPVDSTELVAKESFSFRTDQEITVTVQPATGAEGVANVYTASDKGNADRPDYLSRVTTIRPDLEASAKINYTGTEGILWVEWLPSINSDSPESLTKLTISSNQTTYYVDVQ
jgi:hypothetical protein